MLVIRGKKLLAMSGVILLTACIDSADPRVGPEIAPLVESLCWIVADPAHYEGKLVQVSADIQSDGLEHVQLVDAACENVALAVGVSDRSEPGVGALIDRAFEYGIEGSARPISATFTGTIVHSPGKVPSVTIQVTRVVVMDE